MLFSKLYSSCNFGIFKNEKRFSEKGKNLFPQFLHVSVYCAIFHIFLVTHKNLTNSRKIKNFFLYTHKNQQKFLTWLRPSEKFISETAVFCQIFSNYIKTCSFSTQRKLLVLTNFWELQTSLSPIQKIFCRLVGVV